MGRRTHGPALIHAIEQNNQKKVHEILMLEIRSKKKIKEICTAHCKRPGSEQYACPLLVAAALPDPGLVKYMVVKHEANVNFIYKESNGKIVRMNTALKVAVKGGVYHVVQVLLGLNSDPNIPDHKGRSVLFYAVQNADYRMAKMLVTRGAKVNLADNAGNTPFHMATRYGHLELVKLFVKYGGDLYKKGPDGAIPIHIASKEGHTLLVRYFAQQEVNVNIKVPCYEDGKEKAPLHVACEEGHSNLVQCLLFELSANFDIKDSEGETPLHCTVIREYDPFGMKSKEDYADCAKALLKHGANCNVRNLRGETPLHLAARNEFQRVVELLVDHAANPSIKDNDGNKPIDLVSENDAVTENLLKDALNDLERKTSEALEINARGYSTAIHRPKSAADILEGSLDGSVGRTASVPGLFVSTSDKRLNNTIQGIYRDGYLEPLGSRNTINEQEDGVNNYEDLDQVKKERRKRIKSETRKSREMLIESSSDSYQTDEQRSRRVQRSKSMDFDADEGKVSTYSTGLPQTPQSVKRMMPELNQALAARNGPHMNGPVPGNVPQPGNQQMPQNMQQQNMTFQQHPQQIARPNQPFHPQMTVSNQDTNNNFNKNQQINAKLNANNPVNNEPPVNYFQNVEPIEPVGQYNISIGPPKSVPIPGSPGVRRAATQQPQQQQQQMNGSMPRSVPQQPQTVQKSLQSKMPVSIPIQQAQQQEIQRRHQQGINPISDSDDTFFDDASFDTLSEDNLDDIKKGGMKIQHIVEPRTPTESHVVPVRIGSGRGDPRLMQSWLADQARLIHQDNNAPVAQSSPQLDRHEIDVESMTTISQSEADFDRRITIHLQPEHGGQQHVTIDTAELAKKQKPKPAVKPRKSKSHTPPPQIPSRDTKPMASFRAKKPVPAPPEGGRRHNDRIPEQYPHDTSEDVYETIKDNPRVTPQDDKSAYMAMHSPNVQTEDKSISVQSLDQLQNGDISHDLSSSYNQTYHHDDSEISGNISQQMHPPPSPGSRQRRGSKSKPVAIPTVPSTEEQQSNRNSQISMASTDRGSRASVSSVNTVIYVPVEKDTTTDTQQVPNTNQSTLQQQQQVKQPQVKPVSPQKPQQPVMQQEKVSQKPPTQETRPEELPIDPKKKVSIGHEEVFQEIEKVDPDMKTITYNTGDEMQLVIVGGNAEGIFIHRLVPDSEAEEAGLEEGYQIFSVNGVSLKGKTQEEAYKLLMATKGKVELQAADKEEKYERIMHEGGAGDSFNVRSTFDFVGGDGEISFVKGEIVSVKDTMPNGKIGSWVATKLYARDNETKTGLMPNEERAEQIAKAHIQSETLEKEEKGGFLRRSIRKSKSAKDKRKERTLSTTSVLLEGPVYERVDQKFPGFIRPVVLLGLFCDAVRDRLVTELPEKYEMPPPEAELAIRDTMDYVEKIRILDGQQAAIRRVIGRRKHCLLVVSPKSVQQFLDWDLHPIVIFMSVESKSIVKSLKSKMAPNLEKKPSSLYEDSLHFAKEFSHIFTATVPYTTDDSWYTLLKDSIGRIQNLAVWQKVDEHDGEEKLETTDVRTVTTTNSSGQQRVVHYVQQGSPQKQNGPGGQNLDQPDKPDLGVVRPVQIQGPPVQPVRPQPIRPRMPMQYQQQPYPYMQQQQYYYHPNQAQMYQQQQNWMQQQQFQQGGMDQMHKQVNISSYLGGQPRPAMKEGGPSPNLSMDSTSTTGTGRQQQVNEMLYTLYVC